MWSTALLFLCNCLFLTLHLANNSGSFPKPLSKEEEADCLNRAAAGDLNARNELVEHNLRLVAHIVKKYYTQPDLQDDLIVFDPTVYHHTEWDELFSLGEQFLSLRPDTPKLFYIWGHAYEFDIHDDWDRFEDFCRLISGQSDIFYGTNREVLL